MIKAEVDQAVRRRTVASLAAGELPESGLPAGVKAVAMWRNERLGSVLFFADAASGLFSFGQSSLNHRDARLRRFRGWIATGGGGIGMNEDSDLAEQPPGLVNLGGGSNRDLRLTIGFATSEVATVCLKNRLRSSMHPIGVDGFFLLGITPQDPPTSAIGIGHDGSEIPGPVILL